MSAQAPLTGAPHVVLVTGNSVWPDVRVLKYAATLQRLGLSVTALGLAPFGVPESDETYDGLRVVLCRVGDGCRQAGPSMGLIGLARLARSVLGGRASPVAGERRRHVALMADARRASGGRRWDAFVADTLMLPSHRSGRTATARGAVPDFVGRPLIPEATLMAWASRPGGGALDWRVLVPDLLDLELALVPALEELRPDVVHVHDVFGLGAATRYRERTKAGSVVLIYDVHEDVGGLSTAPLSRRLGYRALEAECIRNCDAVVTVSDGLARRLERVHRLQTRPSVVLNAPVEALDDDVRVGDLRSLAGLGPDEHLLVYGGGVSSGRGLTTVVDALPLLPKVHFTVVARRRAGLVLELEAQAARLGVTERLHWAPYASPEYVTRYLSTADVGVVPLDRGSNHDIALTNKFCEYLRAGLPVLTSDTPTQASLVRSLDVGAVFTAGDPRDLARGVREVLDRHQLLEARIAADDGLRRRFGWTAQAEIIRELYRCLLGAVPPSSPADLTITRLPRP